MADFNMSRKNVYTGRTKIDGRTFQIEFWDDEVDTIRSFDVASQRSIEPVEELVDLSGSRDYIR